MQGDLDRFPNYRREELQVNHSPHMASVLLASASYGGTLAAVRCLGRHGFRVNVISSSHSSPAASAWSRYVHKAHTGPKEQDTARFIARLLELGRAEPGQILLPTSDETAWLYTAFERQLGQYFRLLQPPGETIFRILDKAKFADAAMRAGLATLPSWEPDSETRVSQLAPELSYPILIKRRTHVHEAVNHKGVLIISPNDLALEYGRYMRTQTAHKQGTQHLWASGLPFLQKFVSVGPEGILSVSGYIDRSGSLFVTRCASKVYQRSQPVGVGVCFESRAHLEELSQAVRRLCRELGYFGMFEVEFIRFNSDWAVIDFNPRLFNQMALDIHRGMPIPLFACLDALGDHAALSKAVTAACDYSDEPNTVFCDRFTFRAILMAGKVTRRLSKQDVIRWHAWLRDHAHRMVDVASDSEDRIPYFVHAMSELKLGLRSLPKFLRLPRRTELDSCIDPQDAKL